MQTRRRFHAAEAVYNPVDSFLRRGALFSLIGVTLRRRLCLSNSFFNNLEVLVWVDPGQKVRPTLHSSLIRSLFLFWLLFLLIFSF